MDAISIIIGIAIVGILLSIPLGLAEAFLKNVM